MKIGQRAAAGNEIGCPVLYAAALQKDSTAIAWNLFAFMAEENLQEFYQFSENGLDS